MNPRGPCEGWHERRKRLRRICTTKSNFNKIDRVVIGSIVLHHVPIIVDARIFVHPGAAQVFSKYEAHQG